jgi:hypothetical protein
MRSAKPPIGIAKSNQGNIVKAEIAEIDTGAVVNLTAIRGTETRSTPSAKLLAIAADHNRLKAGENLVIEISLASRDCAEQLLSKYHQHPFPYLGLGSLSARQVQNAQYPGHMYWSRESSLACEPVVR